MNELDWILLAAIAVCAVRCFFRGAIAELMGFAAFILAGLCAVLFFNPVERFARDYVSLGFAAAPLAFLAIFVVVFVIVKLFERSMREALEEVELESLDRALGALLGGCEGCALACAALLLVSMQPFWDASALLSGSWMARTVLPLLSSAYGS